MTLTCTSAPEGLAVVSNQHRDQDRIADSKFLSEAIGHLRHQVQRACSGWTPEPSDDGRHLIGSGRDAFRETIIETRGLYAETIQQYLLTVEPDHTRTLLALLEDLQRGIAAGGVTGTTRRLLVQYAEEILGRKRGPADTRGPRP